MKTPEEIAEEFLIRQGCQRMDCDGENCNFFEDVQPKDLIEFAKWQQKRMFSEEDLLSAFESGMMFIGEDKASFKEWFEQFKKK